MSSGAHSVKTERDVGGIIRIILCIALVLAGIVYFLTAGRKTSSEDGSKLMTHLIAESATGAQGAEEALSGSVISAFNLETREVYTNGRFGFKLDVPVAFMLGSEIDDGGGIVLVSSSLRMTAKAVGYNNNEGLTPEMLADQLWNHRNDSIVRVESNRVVIYQYDREYEYFIWAYVGSGSINQLTIRFPLHDENQDELSAAQALMRNFHPGSLSTTH